MSGRPLSAWQRGMHGAAAGARASTETGADAGAAAWPLISLEPTSRAWLHERIAARFAAMLDAGLVDEVRALRARGDLQPALPSMRCVGYRQAWAALEADALEQGPQEAGTPATDRLDGLAVNVVAATRQLAKRQLTWLRSMPDRIVVACDDGDALPHGVAALRASTHGPGPAHVAR